MKDFYSCTKYFFQALSVFILPETNEILRDLEIHSGS